MAKSRPVVMRKQESNTLTIRVSKVPTGHQAHITGTGVHDSTPKRQRTRNAQRQTWQIEEATNGRR